ncbi:MAG: DUF3846 domain-containing protein [Clostridia bacterium]|nr:DUF3846 domain-containing protein [Clostridia bacterium]
MKKPLYIVILQTDGGIRLQALESGDEPTLEQLQTLVGGYIETVPAMYGVMVINEEGKLFPLPFNANATAMMKNKGLDYIVGDAVLCVPARNEYGEGILTGIPRRHAVRIADSLREGTVSAGGVRGWYQYGT